VGKEWIKETFGTIKPVVAMCHFDALPGDPQYNPQKGMSWIIDRARKNLHSLQDGGVDAVMFSNEFSLPYLLKTEAVTQSSMASIIGNLRSEIAVPFGVNVLWDPHATVELAVAVEASFVREVFTGVYAGDYGLWDTNCGNVVRRRNQLGGENIKLIFNIYPEASVYLGNRALADIARTTVFNALPDALCVSGRTAGVETSTELLREAGEAVPDTPVFANTGVNMRNIPEQLAIADGVIVGTAFKKNGDFFDLVDQDKVVRFMDAVRASRK
jgi:uncharacterized protein